MPTKLDCRCQSHRHHGDLVAVEDFFTGGLDRTFPTNFPIIMSAMSTDSLENNANSDLCSIHVRNVDFKVTAQELEEQCTGCGEVDRVTIRCGSVTKRPLGYGFM